MTAFEARKCLVKQMDLKLQKRAGASIVRANDGRVHDTVVFRLTRVHTEAWDNPPMLNRNIGRRASKPRGDPLPLKDASFEGQNVHMEKAWRKIPLAVKGAADRAQN